MRGAVCGLTLIQFIPANFGANNSDCWPLERVGRPFRLPLY